MPIWNKFANNPYFEKEKPWLLRFFDQVQYYQVSDGELEQMREKFAAGDFDIDIEETTIKPKEINKFLGSIKDEVKTFKEKQDLAFEKEREYWVASGMIGGDEDDLIEALDNDGLDSPKVAPKGYFFVYAHASGIVWKILANNQDKIEKEQPLIILEAMKTEIIVNASSSGTVSEINIKNGQLVNRGDLLMVIKNS